MIISVKIILVTVFVLKLMNYLLNTARNHYLGIEISWGGTTQSFQH